MTRAADNRADIKTAILPSPDAAPTSTNGSAA
jgi:hypothetical protein